MLDCRTLSYTEYENLIYQYLTELVENTKGTHLSIVFRKFKRWLYERNMSYGGVGFIILFYNIVKEFLRHNSIPFTEYTAKRRYYILVLDTAKLKQRLRNKTK
jgi:hypothetical protein